MFAINSYIWFRNTPDGKPRVLREGMNYTFKYNNYLCKFTGEKTYRFLRNYDTIFSLNLTDSPIESDVWIVEKEMTKIKKVANLSDCRPLLSVEIRDKVWTEGDICTYSQELFTREGGSFNPSKFVEKYGFVVFDGYQMNFELYTKMFHLSNAKTHLGSFFDDPAKYSKLLWNCSEEEGWQKVLGLLGVDKQLLTK
jgi:hypothetical protein